MPSDYTTKERTLLLPSLTRKSWTYEALKDQWSPIPPVTYSAGAIQRWESVYSRRNGWPRSVDTGTDVGGNFLKYDFQHVRIGSPLTETVGVNRYYIDALLPYPEVTSVNTIKQSFADLKLSDSALGVMGTRYISDASPTRPRAGLTIALAELKREGLPRLSSDSLLALLKGRPQRLLKGAGSDYLNWQFGWLPIISDVQDLAKSVMTADDLLSQLYRDDGRIVRRRRGDPEERILSETTVLSTGYGIPSLAYQMYPKGAGRIETVTKVTRATWFSGAFMYHLPSNVTPLGKLHKLAVEARYLYGLGLSAIDVWNLVPWSWLVDWYTNVGECLSTFSDQIYNGQILKYGYVMARTSRQVRRSIDIQIGSNIHVASARTEYVLKQRVQATPFGFGTTWDGFTPYQISILSALGLSRLR